MNVSYKIDLMNARPAWVDAERTKIDITVQFSHLVDGPVRFTAAKEDPGYPHSEKIFAEAAAGLYGPVDDAAVR